MEKYTFWYENRAGITFVEKRLTKRQAVIRYNRMDRNLPDDVKRYGWELDLDLFWSKNKI